METPAPGTLVVWSDHACPWSRVAVARLHRVRAGLDLVDSDDPSVYGDLLRRAAVPSGG